MIRAATLPGGDKAGVARTVAIIRQHWPSTPRAGIILGTGLGNLASQIIPEAIFNYDELPDFPRSTAIGHRGYLLCGRFAAQPVVVMDGRFHFYEGYSAAQITLPIAVMRELAVELLIASNASGGLNPRYRSGEIMALVEHIDLMGARTRPLSRGSLPAQGRGARNPYDLNLVGAAQAIARRNGFVCHRGVYVGVVGPNYETRAEYRALRRIGGDAVGMSTVPEVLAAAEAGMRVLALSTITNVARPDAPLHVDAEQVIDVASAAEPRLRAIVLGVLAELPPAT